MKKIQKLEAVLFDLDGVIVDTANDHYLAWKKIAQKEGIYFDRIINERLKGVSRLKSLEIILENSQKQYTAEEKIALCELKNNDYRERIAGLKPQNVLPGVRAFLEELRENNIRTAICSASKSAKEIIKRLELACYFDCIIDGNDVTRPKPDPQVFEKACQHLAVLPDQVIVVEDAFAGIESAQSIGIKTIGIGRPEILVNADVLYVDMLEINLDEIKKNLNFYGEESR